MKNMSVQKCMYVCCIILLVTLFAACSDPSSASGVTPTPTTADTTPTPTTVATATSAANQPATPTSVTGTGKVPTTVAKATSATTANQPATPTPVIGTGTDFQSFTGEDFTVLYPAKWQKTHKTSSGPVAKNQPLENMYGFIAADNITGFHIARHTGEQAVGGSINELLGGEFRCDQDKSVPPQVTIGGVSWLQFGFICLVASNNYEVRELVTSTPSSQHGQTVIMYGAYQKVGKGAVAPDFAHAKATYFDPMLASFKFN